MNDRNKEREVHAKDLENIFNIIVAEISSNPGKEKPFQEKRHVVHQAEETPHVIVVILSMKNNNNKKVLRVSRME